MPEPVGVDPLSTRRKWRWQRKIQYGEDLARTVTDADRHKLVIRGQVDTRHGDGGAPYAGLKWRVEMLVQYRVEACFALAIVVAVNSGLLDHGVQ